MTLYDIDDDMMMDNERKRWRLDYGDGNTWRIEDDEAQQMKTMAGMTMAGLAMIHGW